MRHLFAALLAFAALSTLSAVVPFVGSSAATDYPLSVSPDGRHILDNNGQPVFFNAASPWHLFARLTREKITAYLDDRRSRGFNALLVSMIVSDGYNGSVLNAYGDAPFTGADFKNPNEDYFAHIDWAMQEANSKGFTLFVVPVYMGYQCGSEGWCQEMVAAGTTVMRNFGEWIGARYADQPNIVWVHAGDVDAGDYAGAMDVLEATVEGILTNDTVHLNTAHCSRFHSAIDCYDKPWLQINTTYGDCSQTPQEVKGDYMRNPALPFVFIEGRYEDEGNYTQRCGRSQAYWSLLGGASGHFFGNGGIWDFPSGWENHLESPGAESMQYFRNLQVSRPWQLLEPDYGHTTVTAGYGSMGDGYAPVARADNGNTMIAYIPTARTVTVAMNRISGSTATAWWFDPVGGAASLIGSFPTTGSMDFTSPSDKEWVLVVDDASQHFNAPGQDYVPVTLKSLDVGWRGAESVVTWSMAGDPSGYAGFHVFRGDTETDRERLTQDLLRDRSVYEFVDSDPPREGTGYWIEEVDRTGETRWYGPARLAPFGNPAGLILNPNMPNPFAAQTVMTFQTPAEGHVSLTVYDIRGRVVATLLDSVLPPGTHQADWSGVDQEGRTLPAGIYLVRLVTGEGVRSQRIIKIH